MMQDLYSKQSMLLITDTCFRTTDSVRMLDQLRYIQEMLGEPGCFSKIERWCFSFFLKIGKFFPNCVAFFIRKAVRFEAKEVCVFSSEKKCSAFIEKEKNNGIILNINRLQEAVLGETAAEKNMQQYIEDIKNPLIEMISIKISSIFSQISLIAYDDSLRTIKERLRLLYRTARDHPKSNGRATIIMLDMEAYQDLSITVDAFQELLSEQEFLKFSSGIVLQSYIPESFDILQKITEWAQERKSRGGASILVRIVKGANLNMERVVASLKEIEQPTFRSKVLTDAQFKNMILFSCQPKNAEAVHVGIATHNLFDIAYALVVRTEKKVEKYVHFEMLYKIAPAVASALQEIAPQLVLYCPITKEEHFTTAIAYLMRRFDEQTTSGHFLPHLYAAFGSRTGWESQRQAFFAACRKQSRISTQPRRRQSRTIGGVKEHTEGFQNERDSDFTVAEERKWVKELLDPDGWQKKTFSIPIVAGGESFYNDQEKEGYDPSRPHFTLYTWTSCQKKEIDLAMVSSSSESAQWVKVSSSEKKALMERVVEELQKARHTLIGAMIAECAKNIEEADSEVSEAIDFVGYYTQIFEYELGKRYIEPKDGVTIVASPWNFPCAIPTGGITAALLSGTAVVFKPAPEAILVGWFLVQLFWKAGVPRNVLQFLPCADETGGSYLIQHPLVTRIVLTGSTETAYLFGQYNPKAKLFAETGGKNSIIVSRLADSDLAIRNIVQSAFSYSGQKCSACSLVIAEEEVYNSVSFRRQLQDAVQSIHVGSAWDAKSKVTPLIRSPQANLLKGLTRLSSSEFWLVQPKVSEENLQLWSPGVKFGVEEKSFMHTTELFGPVLSVMPAKDLDHAISIANSTRYGLTAGLESLDMREHKKWFFGIEAGNCYINRPITGALVGRQPFGGMKASNFGIGMKTGGSNYGMQFACNYSLEDERSVIFPKELMRIATYYEEQRDEKRKNILSSYVFWYESYFSQEQVLRRLVGQDNIIIYMPKKEMVLYFHPDDKIEDICLVVAGCLIVQSHPVVFCSKEHEMVLLDMFYSIVGSWKFFEREHLFNYLKEHTISYIRGISQPKENFIKDLRLFTNYVDMRFPAPSGRVELIHYLQEKSFSFDYHRYGNLQGRECEEREMVL